MVLEIPPISTIVTSQTNIAVVSASGRNSLVMWEFEILSDTGVSLAPLTGVLLGPAASTIDDHYSGFTLDVIPTSGPTETVTITAYDPAFKLARVNPALSAVPANSSDLIINVIPLPVEHVDPAEPTSDHLLALHNFATPPPNELRGLNLRIDGTFQAFDFYSRATGMVLMTDPLPTSSFDYVLYNSVLIPRSEFLSGEDTGSVPELSWEYFNGRGWLSLTVVDGTRNLLSDGLVVINRLPKDIELTEVAGQENFWIRARLAGGDYGRETFRVDTVSGKIVSEKSSLRPPQVRSLGISYQAQPAAPEACLTFNNLDYIDQTAACQTAGSRFPPFETPEDPSLTLFFGFDKTFKSGPVRLLLDAAERDYDESKPPEFEWNFRKDRVWKKLDADDDSIALTRQGILTLSASAELTRETRFGQSLFWIKGSLRTDRGLAETGSENGAPDQLSAGENESAEVSCGCSCSCSCSKATKATGSNGDRAGTQDQAGASATVVAATAEYPLPLLRGVFLNTVWATQGETITEEIIGSGDGEPNQTHNLQNGDVLEGEDVRVREVLSAEERERIEQDFGEESITDREDLGGTWVRWKAVKALFDCGTEDRCYEIDRAPGSLRFGDGAHGRTVPAGVDNIRAFSYRTGGGAFGNVASNRIQALATAVAGVESVFNPAPSGGGSDKADTNAMLITGPRQISHLDRAVSVEDFEELAQEASRQVAKVRCLATTNLKLSGIGRPDPCDPGQLHEAFRERGRVSLIIVPDSKDPRPCPSVALRREVKKYLLDRAPSVIAAGGRIVVRPPDYVTVSVAADIFVTTLERASAAETAARNELNDFLHPVTGGPEGMGWDFGRPVSKSDVFALLERISDIDRVENLEFRFRGQTNSDRVEIGPNELLASGEHTLAIKKA